MDLIRFMVVRWMLRRARRMLTTYVDRHHPGARHRADLAVGAIDIALAGIQTTIKEHRKALHMRQRLDKTEIGSDDQLTAAQKERIAAQLDAERGRVRAEEQRTAAQPVEDDGDSHHRGGV